MGFFSALSRGLSLTKGPSASLTSLRGVGSSAVVSTNRTVCQKVAHIPEAVAADIWAAAPSAVVFLVLLSLYIYMSVYLSLSLYPHLRFVALPL